MCCGLAVLGILGPRALIVFWWLVDPARWAVTFNNGVLLPALGLVFTYGGGAAGNKDQIQGYYRES